MARVSLEGVVKRYGETEVIHGIDLEVASGTFTVFVGPSGCGKSTLLRMVAGLEAISGGEVRIDGVRVNERAPHQRGVSMVFQNYALYPHMTVRQNMAFGLKMAGARKAEIERRVAEAAGILQLEPFLERQPAELSGGQRQRVAIGRAITREPKVFLFDEPLSNLDAELRMSMRVEIARLHREIDTTMIFVTHDQIEAMTLADEIVVLNKGRVEQVGPPETIYQRPANTFVAGFIGSPRMNLIAGEVVAGDTEAGKSGLPHARLSTGFVLPLPQRVAAQLLPGEAVTMGIRPEALRLSASDGKAGFVGRIYHREYIGSQTFVYLRTGSSPDLETDIILADPAPISPAIGSDVGLSYRLEDVQWFDGAGRAILV